ncbi:uncharacterized protein RAG0_14637 [Rhynchosporium agropyri]|uniref:Uncharacterized protein n=1 Tax=Rhynchosporium agropyri TaxID=914238 RepID=A0A1E1LHL4_9HELO|nr:uncharacterized protein RAG0_14637 [Rhynchosporium agropyri]
MARDDCQGLEVLSSVFTMGLFGENRENRDHGLAAKHSIDKGKLQVDRGHNSVAVLYMLSYAKICMRKGQGGYAPPNAYGYRSEISTSCLSGLKDTMVGIKAGTWLMMGLGLRHRTDIEFLCESWRVTLLPLSQLVTIVPLQVEGRSERLFPPQRTIENPRRTAQSCLALSDTGERRIYTSKFKTAGILSGIANYAFLLLRDRAQVLPVFVRRYQCSQRQVNSNSSLADVDMKSFGSNLLTTSPISLSIFILSNHDCIVSNKTWQEMHILNREYSRNKRSGLSSS